MAYTYNPTDWHTGDIITEGKLNNIEDGIKGLYPTREVILPPQEITIESNTPITGVEIQLPTGATINNDVWAQGGYIITVSTAPDSEPFPSREVLFYVESAANYNIVSYEAYVGDSDVTESEYNCIIKRDMFNNVLTFMALRWSSDVSYAWPGTYTISIIQPGFINLPYVAVPKLLVDVEHPLFMSAGLFAVADGEQQMVSMINHDCFDSLCALLLGGGLQFVQRKFFEMVYPISGEPEDQGFYLNEQCLGLTIDIGNGDSFTFIPDNVDYRYWESEPIS